MVLEQVHPVSVESVITNSKPLVPNEPNLTYNPSMSESAVPLGGVDFTLCCRGCSFHFVSSAPLLVTLYPPAAHAHLPFSVSTYGPECYVEGVSPIGLGV